MADGVTGLDEAELLAIWDAHGARMMWARSAGRGADPEVVARAVAELPEVSALDALEANTHLVELLVARRWSVMQTARETGASWSEIGAALGMSKQAAHEWYGHRIAEQEHHAGELHNTERARAALKS